MLCGRKSNIGKARCIFSESGLCHRSNIFGQGPLTRFLARIISVLLGKSMKREMALSYFRIIESVIIKEVQLHLYISAGEILEN